ncbi:MAG TPA: hypothetical protein VF371_12340 [Candidatus Limnocylindrales bacterium]
MAIDPVRLNPDAGFGVAAVVGVGPELVLSVAASVGAGVSLAAGDGVALAAGGGVALAAGGGVVPSGGGKVAELPEQPATARAASRPARPSRLVRPTDPRLSRTRPMPDTVSRSTAWRRIDIFFPLWRQSTMASPL